VLEADEGDPAPVDDEFTGIRRTHAHHQHDIGRLLDAEHVHRPRNRLVGDPLEVDRIQQRVEIAPVGAERGLDDLDRRRTVGIEDIVTPVGVEERSMCGVENFGRRPRCPAR
jgi:hypothetical protein